MSFFSPRFSPRAFFPALGTASGTDLAARATDTAARATDLAAHRSVPSGREKKGRISSLAEKKKDKSREKRKNLTLLDPPPTPKKTKKRNTQGLGVGALRRSYGGRDKSRGCAPERHALAAGGLVRHILQQLESIGIVEKSADGSKKGRRITPQGQRDLDLIAGRCPGEAKPVFGAQPEPPVEAVVADE